MAAPQVPWVNDGDAGNAAVTKRPLKYILTASGMDVDNTGFTGLSPVFNPIAFASGALVSNGVVDATAVVQAAATAAAGNVLWFPAGTYLLSSQVNIPSNTKVLGVGPTSIIKTTTVSTHLFVLTGVSGTTISDLKFLGVKGTNVLNNSAVYFLSTSSYCTVERCEMTGMSGIAVHVTGASHHITIRKNHIYALTSDTSYINSCDIALDQDAHFCRVEDNDLDGGIGADCGVLMQANSTDHLIRHNRITAHSSYGIIDYDTTPRNSNNVIHGNTIRDIDGSTRVGASGAGIYLAGVGGTIITKNRLTNCNVSTSDWVTLAPGAIGINGAFGPIEIEGNVIQTTKGYGIYVVAGISSIAHVSIRGNEIEEATMGGMLIKGCSYVDIIANTVVQLTAAPLTVRCIAVNIFGGGPYTAVRVRNNCTVGGTVGIDMGFTNNAACDDNEVSAGTSTAIKVASGTGITVRGNNANAPTAGNAILLSDVVSGMVTGNVCASAATDTIATTGTCTGTVIDETNRLIGKTVVNIANAGVGAIVRAFGSTSKGSNNSQVGDRVLQSVPVVASPKGWSCTVAGNPGTYVSEGNL